jgi:hypothetical protein
MYMDENVVKQTIQKAFSEPQAPEGLIQQVILRTRGATMGVQAQKQPETASAEKGGELLSEGATSLSGSTVGRQCGPAAGKNKEEIQTQAGGPKTII